MPACSDSEQFDQGGNQADRANLHRAEPNGLSAMLYAQPTASWTFFGNSRMIAHTSSGSALAVVTYKPCTPRSR